MTLTHTGVFTKTQIDHCLMQINTHAVCVCVCVCVSGILYGTMTLEMGGQVSIACEKTGYSAQLEFKLKVCVCVYTLMSGCFQAFVTFRRTARRRQKGHTHHIHIKPNATPITAQHPQINFVWHDSMLWLILSLFISRSSAAVISWIRSAGRSSSGRRCWQHLRGTGWV